MEISVHSSISFLKFLLILEYIDISKLFKYNLTLLRKPNYYSVLNRCVFLHFECIYFSRGLVIFVLAFCYLRLKKR